MKVPNILLVDDDNLDVLDFKRSLDRMNVIYHLEIAKNGEEALYYLHKVVEDKGKLPDILIIDINMPRLSGLELLEELRKNKNFKDLKCFMLTTSDEKHDKERAKQLGVSGYVTKPFKINNPATMDSFNLVIDLLNMKG